MAKKRTLENQIICRIKRSTRSVFLRQDFETLGGYDQVGRILRQLIRKQFLIKIGYGIYMRSKVSDLSGNIITEKPLPTLAKEALKRLGIKTYPTKAEDAYRDGNSTQVPTGQIIGIQGRFSRKISCNGRSLFFEKRYN